MTVYGTKDTEENDTGDISGEIAIMTAVAAAAALSEKSRDGRDGCNEGGAREDEKDGRGSGEGAIRKGGETAMPH